MAQPHSQAQQRPQFSHQSQSFTPGFPQPNGRPQLSPQSPQHSMSYTSPPPQSQFTPSYSPQAPPPKRQRMSPDAPSPFSPTVQSPQAGSPVNGQMNGMVGPSTPRTGLMPPPQQPMVKREERDTDGATIRGSPMEYDQNVGALFSYVEPSTSQATTAVPDSSFDATTQLGSSAPSSSIPMPSVSQEERTERDQQRQDWDESRHSQHELWDPFLFIGTLNDKIKSVSHRANLAEPQAGVLVNTQKNQPPPIVRVNGLEGATRVIRDGQSILDTKEKADRLSELVKLLSLSAKARITNVVQAAARLAIERRQHSQGRVPDDWSDVAVKPKTSAENEEGVSSPTISAGMKRSHSQANSETSVRTHGRIPHPASAEFDKYSNKEAKAELARQARKRRRTDVNNAQDGDAATAAQEEALTAAALEADKKTTKKERKMAESKISEQQQHASTNEAARMATASIFGSKKKQYSWMTGGGAGGGGGGAGLLSRTPSAAATPRSTSVSAPVKDRTPQTRKGPQIGQFDENSEPGVQIRDLLLVLESDGRAAKSFVRGSSVTDDYIPRSGV